jgi:radical SAM-linked protein
MSATRLRIRFAKQGDLRLISHRDLVRTMERLFCRAEVPVAMSEGFHPKPRMRFPSALALGIAGLDEVLEVDLAEPREPAELLERLRAQAPPGLAFRSAAAAPPGGKKAQATSVSYELPLAGDQIATTGPRVSELMAAPALPVVRQPGGVPVDLRPLIQALEVDGAVLRMRLRVTHEAGARPRELLAALGWTDLDEAEMHLVRTSVEVEP